MYSLLFRNRWFAALWALAMLGSAYAVAKRGDPMEVRPAHEASVSAEDDYARWVAEGERPAPREDSRFTATTQDGQVVELREVGGSEGEPAGEFAPAE